MSETVTRAAVTPAGEADWREIAAMLAELRREELAFDPLAGELLDGGRPLALLMRRLCEEERGRALVARDGTGVVLGLVFACHRPSGDGTAPAPRQGLLSHLYVRPSGRRRGVARALVGAAVAHLLAEGCLAADLSVNVRNRAALDLYRAAGWRPLYELLRLDLTPGEG